MDFIGKYESLNEDWRAVSERVGLPSVELPWRHKRRIEDGLPCLDADLQRKVYERYHQDYKLCGYPHPGVSVGV